MSQEVCSFPLGESLPPKDLHAVSVSLPTWNDIVRYMAQDRDVHNKLQCDYPRFYQHASVERLNNAVLHRLDARTTHQCVIFPSQDGMIRCDDYFGQKAISHGVARVSTRKVSFRLAQSSAATADIAKWARFSALIYPAELVDAAAEFWGIMGDGISSRHADFCFEQFRCMECIEESDQMPIASVGPASRQDNDSMLTVSPGLNLTGEPVARIKALIAAWATSQQSNGNMVNSENDVFIYPKGMCAISAIARALVPVPAGSASEAVVFGWPYGSTPKCIKLSGYERFTFYSQGTSEELDELETSLQAGLRISCLFCEVPSNPLCATPDLYRIRSMADRYHFAVVCDDTIGTSINVDILPLVDIIVTSLTKTFSGACNVMGGSVVLNSRSQLYPKLHEALTRTHEDLVFPLDAQVLLNNCLDFPARVQKTNCTALAIVKFLQSQPSTLISSVKHPTTAPTARLYEQLRRKPDGGYGSLISIVFQTADFAVQFYDGVDLCKGPSLGANFTLVLPYSQLAHAFELDWAESLGMPKHIIRISVGLEDATVLTARLSHALQMIQLRT